MARKLQPGLYEIANVGTPRKAMFEWHGYTVFLVGRISGVNVRNKETAQHLGDAAVLRVQVGVAFCSPKEPMPVPKEVNGIIQSRDRIRVERGFFLAENRMTKMKDKTLELRLGLGTDLERGFKTTICGMPLYELSKLGVPDRMIEAIKGLHEWTYHTIRNGNGTVESIQYHSGQRQERVMPKGNPGCYTRPHCGHGR